MVHPRNVLLRRIFYLAAALILLQALFFMGLIAFSCKPVHAYWDQAGPWSDTHEFHCFSARSAIATAIPTQVILEAVLVLLSLFLLRSAPFSMRHHSAGFAVRQPRIVSALSAVAALGLIAFGCVRIIKILRNIDSSHDFICMQPPCPPSFPFLFRLLLPASAPPCPC